MAGRKTVVTESEQRLKNILIFLNCIMSYLTDIRLRHTKRLLAKTSLTIQEVCYKCGFQAVPHFCRMFKQKLGMTAKKWKQANKP